MLRVKEALDARTFRKTLDLIGKRDPRILDVGGGTGEISSEFVRASGGHATATVVDIDPRSIEVARQRGLGGFVGRIEDYETDERFDLILLLNLIEHVADPLGVLSSARRHLAPQGILWLQTPNFRALDARIFRHRNWAGYHCPRHFVIFSEMGLRRALDRVQLDPVRFERTQGGPFWSGSLLGVRRRGWSIAEGGLPPLMNSGAYAPLAALGAGFDFVTRGLRQVSQVRVLVRTG